MTPEELAAYVAELRAEVIDTLEWLATVDPDGLLPSVRAEYEQQVQRCRELFALTEPEAVALQEEAAVAAGGVLTLEEARALILNPRQ